VRHTLDGTGYTTTAGGTKVTTGCGNGGSIAACNGYELLRNLDFADGVSYASGEVNTTWCPAHATNGCDSATATGWTPIGDSSNQFNAIFDGNGHTISNLYARGSTRVGLFGQTGTNAALRNIGVVANRLYGGSGQDEIGGLVGRNRGSITTSYASGSIDGGGNIDRVGGLVGRMNSGSITASYATGNVTGGAANDAVGGLVGQVFSSITASYATGNADGGAGGDSVGGLVGSVDGSTITASYATGNADGGADNDNVDRLIGHQAAAFTIESYGFGTATGETELTSYTNTLVRRGMMVDVTFSTVHPNTTLGAAMLTAGSGPAADTTNAGAKWADSASTAWDWDFGTNTQHPALVVDFNGDGMATWQEFGNQPR